MQRSPKRDIRDTLGPYLVPTARTVLGVCLGVVLSMTGIAVAWSLFIFFGSQSAGLWLTSLFIGSGLGAGTACYFAWLRIDGDEKLIMALTAVIVVGAGIIGAWGGYEYGSNQEIECCAMPTVSPVYYTALGSTVVANVAGVVLAAVRAFLGK